MLVQPPTLSATLGPPGTTVILKALNEGLLEFEIESLLCAGEENDFVCLRVRHANLFQAGTVDSRHNVAVNKQISWYPRGYAAELFI
jgi:hypothetical protein